MHTQIYRHACIHRHTQTHTHYTCTHYTHAHTTQTNHTHMHSCTHACMSNECYSIVAPGNSTGISHNCKLLILTTCAHSTWANLEQSWQGGQPTTNQSGQTYTRIHEWQATQHLTSEWQSDQVPHPPWPLSCVALLSPLDTSSQDVGNRAGKGRPPAGGSWEWPEGVENHLHTVPWRKWRQTLQEHMYTTLHTRLNATLSVLQPVGASASCLCSCELLLSCTWPEENTSGYSPGLLCKYTSKHTASQWNVWH